MMLKEELMGTYIQCILRHFASTIRLVGDQF